MATFSTMFLMAAGENGRHLSAASTSFLSGDTGSIACTISTLPIKHVVGQKAFRGPRAERTTSKGFQYPKMMKKPRFWWRILACLPYIMPLHEPWMYAQTAFNLHPFLMVYQYLTYPFLGALGRLPSWFLLAYFFTGYLGVVRRKEWPHFFRFHVVSGMLLEILLQVFGIVWKWVPSGFYWGKLGMHFWTMLAFGYLFTVIECIRCAICGMYADVPFVASAAYIQIPVDQSGPID
ncbi:Protein TIC 20-I, chloroplastic [Asimina triloba]